MQLAVAQQRFLLIYEGCCCSGCAQPVDKGRFRKTWAGSGEGKRCGKAVRDPCAGREFAGEGRCQRTDFATGNPPVTLDLGPRMALSFTRMRLLLEPRIGPWHGARRGVYDTSMTKPLVRLENFSFAVKSDLEIHRLSSGFSRFISRFPTGNFLLFRNLTHWFC